MTPIDRTAQSQTEAISFEFDLHHSPEKVWRALTDPDLAARSLRTDPVQVGVIARLDHPARTAGATGARAGRLGGAEQPGREVERQCCLAATGRALKKTHPIAGNSTF